ncbi:hypothetical protein OPT61_g7001 [Boeremia exigua]|uniref:Uncharacterized protein n=1 Tax=Boeremia exigua TaxID=749465 RepID=A0ACC2I3V0_9PLEO|nr:hypothetical protein OPT61_g7001 [Boeremia exigua]
MLLSIIAAVLLNAYQTYAQTYQLHPAIGSGLIDASSECTTTFSSNVTCHNIIGQLYADPFFTTSDDTTLNKLCQARCLGSLTKLRDDVRNTCAGAQYYDEYEDTYWVPTYPDEFILYAYNMACLKRSTGQFCNTYLKSLTTAAECDECIIRSFQMQVNSPFAVDPGMRENYASLTESCGATGYPTSIATSLLISSSIPTATCSGTTYIIKPTDTFKSVPLAESVSTEQLLNSNGLPYNATLFPKSGELCISNKCKTHVLAEGDTCDSIAKKASISPVQFKAWNANVNQLCSNLERFIGDTFCISNPYGDFSIPDQPIVTAVPTPVPAPSDIAPNVTSRCGQFYRIGAGDDCSTVTLKFNILLSDFYFLNPVIDVSCSNLWLNTSYCVQPVGDITTYPGYGGSTTATLPPFTTGPKTSLPPNPDPVDAPDQIIIPMANDTRVDCWSYMWLNESSPESTDCWGIAAAIGIEREEFALWNPSLDQNPIDTENATYDYPCSAQVSVSYCIGIARPTPVWDEPAVVIKPPTPRASGEIEGCIFWQEVFEGDECAGFLPSSLTVADFFKMNPSVGKDCTGLSVGTLYCLSTLEIGMWAPSEDIDSPSPTSTTAPISSGTPTPVQDGMVSGCTKFYQVVLGDGCWGISNANSIEPTDFYAWNPAVGSDCETLQPDYYVCVARAPVTSLEPATKTSTGPAAASTQTSTPTPTDTRPPPPGPTQEGIPTNCIQWVLQKPDVYCFDMAAAAGISVDLLYQLNPALNGDCSGLWPDYAYCIGVA